MNITDALINLANNLKIGHEIDMSMLKNLDAYTKVFIPVNKTLAYYSFGIVLASNNEDAKILLLIYKDWQLIDALSIYDTKLSLMLIDYLTKSIKNDNYVLDKFNSYIDNVLNDTDIESISDDFHLSILMSYKINMAIQKYCIQSFLNNISESD